MTSKKPVSFKIAIVVISISIIVYSIAAIFSYYGAPKKYAMILALIMFIALSFTTIGIYTGFKYKTDERKYKILNRIGLIGNLLIFLYVIGLMIIGALMNVD